MNKLLFPCLIGLFVIAFLDVRMASGFIFGFLIPATSVCYGDYGCFSTTGKFFSIVHRPISLLPQSPEKINVRFHLMGRQSRYHILAPFDEAGLQQSGFDSQKKTYFIVHGFMHVTMDTWMKDMGNALLESSGSEKEDNVFLVDWRNGALTPNYPQAVANTRLVGVIIAKYIEWLEKVRAPFSRSNVRIIGHSLGAHTAGYAGKALNGQVGEITGLDPAGPFFNGLDQEVRLGPGDAKFVQAVHTDALPASNVLRIRGMGTPEPSGHLDIFVNGGNTQPGCQLPSIFHVIGEQGILAGLETFGPCPHMRVLDLMTESIKGKPSCQFRAYPCGSYENYKAGSCLECGTTGCANMGFKANQWNPNGRIFVKMFLETNEKSPFCNVAYKVTVNGDSDTLVKGKLRITFIKSGKNSRTMELTPDQSQWKPQSVTILKGNLDDSIEYVDKIEVQFIPDLFSASYTFGIQSIEVLNAENQRKFIFQGPIGANRTPTGMLPQ